MSAADSGAGRESFARYRDKMAAYGFRPSKKFGQNFLLDPTLHRAIADAAELQDGAQVLEIGTGLGFLTRELAARARRVVTAEIDPRLARLVRDELSEWPGGIGARVELVEGDALGGGDEFAEPIRRALAGSSGSWALVANLPYAISGRLLAAALTTSLVDIDRIVVVVQREMAERLAAPPGTRDYGGLSVLARARGSVEIVRGIGREVFRPRPNVDSALLRLRCGQRRLPPGFGPFIRTMFASRRKTLRHALDRLAATGAQTSDELRARFAALRVEQCSPDDLLEIFAALQR